ncbi:MAG: cytidine deaminase [Oscillospiraceae bacterium]|nr:cytidine deaminase [Oscillospiraceae bacterium]
MTRENLIAQALQMREMAYAPYSRFRVGAALEAEDGTVYTGCNVENAAYGCCICAERTALVKAVSEGRRRFVRLAVAGDSADFCWPCGSCRQMLREFSPDLVVDVVNRAGEFSTVSLSDLLPHSFGPDTLE